jgi:hypothetical protein
LACLAKTGAHLATKTLLANGKYILASLDVHITKIVCRNASTRPQGQDTQQHLFGVDRRYRPLFCNLRLDEFDLALALVGGETRAPRSTLRLLALAAEARDPVV